MCDVFVTRHVPNIILKPNRIFYDYDDGSFLRAVDERSFLYIIKLFVLLYSFCLEATVIFTAHILNYSIYTCVWVYRTIIIYKIYITPLYMDFMSKHNVSVPRVCENVILFALVARTKMFIVK